MSKPGRVPPDKALPGLAIALDGDLLLEELRRRIPECSEGLELQGIASVDVQYQPGKSASLLARVKIAGPKGRQRTLLALRVLPLGQSPPEVPEAVIAKYHARRKRRDGRLLSPLREPVQTWSELGVHVLAFPVDPLLPTLGDALDPLFMRVALQRAWQPRGVRVRSVDVKLLSYTPGARAAIRYEVLSEDKRTGVPELRRLVGKLQRRRPAAQLFAGHWAAWRSTFSRVAIVPPVGYIETAGLSLQEFIDGRRLSDFAGTGRFLKHVKQAGRGIARVGGHVLPLPSSRDAAKEVRTVERWVGVVSRLRPDLAERVEAHGRRLSATLAERFRARGTVHSDFHLANVMVGSGGATLIDWDQVAHGDPALDPARFLGALRIAALRVTGEPDGLAAEGEAFLDSYLKERPAEERQVRLFESLALLISSASPFRLQRPGWEAHAELLVAESERALEFSLRGPALAVQPSLPDRLPLATRRDWALDLEYSRACLAPLIRREVGEDLELTEVAPKLVWRAKGFAHLRWTLRGWRGGERWRHQVEGYGLEGHSGTGLLRRLERVREALSDRPEALHVPRPLGHVGALGLVIVERPVGVSISKLLATDEAGPALDRLAVGLAALATTPLQLERERPSSRDVATVSRRLARLTRTGHAAAPRLAAALRRVSACERTAPPRAAPTPHPIALDDVLVGEDGLALKLVRDLVNAPRGLAAGSVLADLQLLVLRGEAPKDAPRRLRERLLEVSAMPPAELAASEAIMLLRRASLRLTREPDDERALALLVAAEEILEGAAPESSGASGP